MNGQLQKKIVNAFRDFNLENMEVLNSFYSSDVVFVDPLHKVEGLADLKVYYRGLYQQVKSIHFDFEEFIEQGNLVSCRWVMSIELKKLNVGKVFQVHGSSFFRFDSGELVSFHRDYFDVGEMLYEQIPLLGSAVKIIKSMTGKTSP